jgi:phosphohistidine phosphatase
MKYLTLFRHGEAVRGTAEMSDYDRPLTEAGRAETARTAAWMKRRGMRPDAVLCSTAARARKTLEVLGDALPADSVTFSDRLYLASPGDLLACIQEAAEVEHLLVLGHNPGLHEFQMLFAPRGAIEALRKLEAGFATAALAALRFPVAAWMDMPGAGGKVEEYQAPSG